MNLTQIIRSYCKYKPKMSDTYISSLIPTSVRGMTHLDREKFSRTIRVPVIKVPDDKISKIIKICKPYTFKLEKFKPIQSLETNPSVKGFFLNPEKVSKWSDLEEADSAQLKENGIDEGDFLTREVQLTYDNFKFDTVFKAVLPVQEEIVSGFSQIGHIIHLNLKDHLREYAPFIGQVLVDKILTCRTVVNKRNVIDNTFRNFNMDVIAGEEDFIVTVKENQCKFKFDFSKVYWNPRLCKEHERILSLLKPGDILFDVFCGVGPFAIPAAKRKCRVFANDLNPESYKWLNENAQINHINKSLFKSFNQDGGHFICNTFKNFIIQYCQGKEKIEEGSKIHITMNLPALAVEFLKHFRNLIDNETLLNEFNCEIYVYVYCFVSNGNINDAKQMVIDNIGINIPHDMLDVFDVRNVAPKKEMVRVTFKLTKEILFDIDNSVYLEPPNKRQCVVMPDVR